MACTVHGLAVISRVVIDTNAYSALFAGERIVADIRPIHRISLRIRCTSGSGYRAATSSAESPTNSWLR